MPWYVVAILLMWEYPFSFTGEWVELLAGGLFLMSTRPVPATFWTIIATAVVFGAAMTPLAGALQRGRDASLIACARVEVQGLTDDIAEGEAGLSKLWGMRRVHKRIWSSIGESYIDPAQLRHFNAMACPNSAGASAQVRRRYGIDPWGTAYWLLVEEGSATEHQVLVYSFGPNRRRDVAEHGVNPQESDDIVASPAVRR